MLSLLSHSWLCSSNWPETTILLWPGRVFSSFWNFTSQAFICTALKILTFYTSTEHPTKLLTLIGFSRPSTILPKTQSSLSQRYSIPGTNFFLVWVTIVVMKDHDQMQIGDELICCTLPCHYYLLEEIGTRTQVVVELGGKKWCRDRSWSAAYWLIHLPYRTRTIIPWMPQPSHSITYLCRLAYS